MKLLALECSSGEGLSVAVLEDGNLVRDLGMSAPRQHVEKLAPLVAEILGNLAWKPADLGAVALSLGPGSFTGLRCSLAFAKGLCFATGARLLGVSTLEAWAWPERAGECQVWLKAGKDRIYRAGYRQGLEVLPGSLLDLLQAQAEAPPGVKILGDLGPEASGPLAMAVGYLAWQRFENGEADDPRKLEPLYLRRAEAEVLWEKRHGV